MSVICNLKVSLFVLFALSFAQGAPQINEICPFNPGIISDFEGDSSDWIEITHSATGPVDLSGYFLTDDPTALNKWAFPPGTIITAQDPYLIVFLSGKNISGGELHANFQLDGDGEFLAIVEPDGQTIATSFSPSYPPVPNGLSYGREGAKLGYFTNLTPGAPNGVALAGFVERPNFSATRGHYDAEFELTLTPPISAPGAIIRYTLDGSEPTETSGLLYQQPLQINSTTVVRAIALQSGFVPSRVTSHSFLFASETILQSDADAQAIGFPSTWEYVNPASDDISIINTADYAMDSSVVNDGRYDVVEALRSIPSISISLSNDHLFKVGQRNSQTPPHGQAGEGIYVNPGGEWIGGSVRDLFERPASFEYIPPAGQLGDEQEDCGLRMQGTSSTRPTTYLKLSFRVVFRRIYGASNLRHDIFPNDPDASNTHNSLVLRGGSSDKWDHELSDLVSSPDQAQYLRDSFVRRMQREAGEGTTARSDWVHVYLNGIYWGLYNMIERIDPQWVESYEGGSSNDYETFSDRNPSENTSFAAQELERLLIESQFLLDQSDFEQAAGTLNMPSFASYMMVNQLALTRDWPGQNFRASGALDLSRPWEWHVSGADQTLVAASGEELNFLSFRNLSFGINPGRIWDHLRINPLFREIFADLVQRHFLADDGVFTEENLRALYQNEMDQIRVPLEAESARWGDARGVLRTPLDDWLPLVSSVRDDFLPDVRSTLLDLYTRRGLTSPVPAPTISPRGGELLVGDRITISPPENTTVYYTTDGSDPKTSLQYERSECLSASAPWRSLRTVTEPVDWSTPGFDDTAWTPGSGRFTIPHGDPQPFELYRFPFDISDQASLDSLLGLVLFADSARSDTTFYLNGQEITSETRLAFSTRTPLVVELSSGIPRLQVGTNIMGIRIFRRFLTAPSPGLDGIFALNSLQCFSHLPVSNQPAGLLYTQPIASFPGLSNLKARARDNSTNQWSALSEVSFDTGLAPTPLVISELHYRPSNPISSAEIAVSTNRDDYEFIELLNTDSAPLELDGYFFSDGISFTFPAGSQIRAGERLILVSDVDAFNVRYPSLSSSVAGVFSGSLSNGGERVILNSPESPLIDFTYSDNAPWPESADGDGLSLVLLKPFSNPQHSQAENWRLSSQIGGNPATSDALSLDSWIARNGISDLEGDDDGDGQANLLEFLFGSDPQSANSPNHPLIGISGDGSVTLSAELSVAALDAVDLVVEESDDLIIWRQVNFLSDGDSFRGRGIVDQNFLLPDVSTQLEEKNFYRLNIERSSR